MNQQPPNSPASSQMTLAQKKELLRTHFSNNVTKQTRILLQVWEQQSQDIRENNHWPKDKFDQFNQLSEKINLCCEKTSSPKYQALITALLHTLNKHTKDNDSWMDKEVATIDKIMATLRKSVSRKTDSNSEESPLDSSQIPELNPVIIACANIEESKALAEQMEYYGFTPFVVEDLEGIYHNSSIDPSAFVIDVHFHGHEKGLEFIEAYQKNETILTPTIFINEEEPDITLMLRSIRSGGISMMPHLEPQSVINQLNGKLNVSNEEPLKILVVDDSKSQAMYSEKLLNMNGFTVKTITDPMLMLEALDEFQPEIVLMDMYMPGCNGMELASVIRQNNRYINMPIIYLSGEEDLERQLAAMAEGGDDFLTKPINPKHLITTIRTRGRRARQLQDLISRDSLTGLLNHTYTLDKLANEMKNADETGAPLCFAMVDIDKFKMINDNYGHPTGDEVIRNLALYLTQRFRKTDGIGRYGGEEFAIILPNTNIDDALHVLDDVREKYSHLIHGGKHSIKSTFSCGVAEYHQQSLSELLDQADQALYQAKNAGRNQVKFHQNSGD